MACQRTCSPLGFFISLLGSLGVPEQCTVTITWYPESILVHVTEIVLGRYMALFGGLSVPGTRRIVVLFDPEALTEDVAEIILSPAWPCSAALVYQARAVL